MAKSKNYVVPKPPSGYRLCKEYPTYTAVSNDGKKKIWIPGGWNLEDKFIKGFWKDVEIQQDDMSYEQNSRFRKWLLEEG